MKFVFVFLYHFYWPRYPIGNIKNLFNVFKNVDKQKIFKNIYKGTNNKNKQISKWYAYYSFTELLRRRILGSCSNPILISRYENLSIKLEKLEKLSIELSIGLENLRHFVNLRKRFCDGLPCNIWHNGMFREWVQREWLYQA